MRNDTRLSRMLHVLIDPYGPPRRAGDFRSHRADARHQPGGGATDHGAAEERRLREFGEGPSRRLAAGQAVGGHHLAGYPPGAGSVLDRSWSRTSPWPWASRRCSSPLPWPGKAPCGWRYSPTWAPACWWCSTVCDCCASVSERPHWPPPAPLRWGFFLPWEKHKQAMAYLLGTLPWLPASRSKAPYDELS